MHIYFSGIGGAGLAPLAQISLDVGLEVSGSDACKSLNTKELEKRGLKIKIGQTEKNIENCHQNKKIDWFVYSSGIREDHPERQFIKEWNDKNPNDQIKESKRDELLNYIISKKKLKLIAVSGTHGKTTTTGMAVWVFKQLRIPISYSIGSNITFGPSAKYEEGSEFFVYECDEFDRNFLNFTPFATIITSLDYDHHDTYPTIQDYQLAFEDFINTAKEKVVGWQKDLSILKLQSKKVKMFDSEKADLSKIKLPGQHNRQNAFLVIETIKNLLKNQNIDRLYEVISNFPGTQRRMEKIGQNLYTDYAHHPVEIRATLELASGLSQNVIAVYQPHQNIRQHRLKNEYTDCFKQAKKVYWLPTYLSREDKNLKILEPKELIKEIKEKDKIEISETNSILENKINQHIQNGDLIILMGAGSIDEWGRQNLT